jgi:hypothetical protein
MLAGKVPADYLTFDYSSIENEVKSGGKNHVGLTKISDTPIVYRASCVWNFRHPVSQVAKVALDFSRYTHIFRYVYRCDRIVKPKEHLCSLGTWYVEGRAAIARVWAIGNIDTLCWTDSSHLRFLASQNEDPFLEARWRSQKQGWLNFRTHVVHIAAFVVAAGRDSCRIGVVAQGEVKQPMPQWLVAMATNIILSQLLSDIESEVARRVEEHKKKEAPWYRRWF